jgi:hypothetical protein
MGAATGGRSRLCPTTGLKSAVSDVATHAWKTPSDYVQGTQVPAISAGAVATSPVGPAEELTEIGPPRAARRPPSRTHGGCLGPPRPRSVGFSGLFPSGNNCCDAPTSRSQGARSDESAGQPIGRPSDGSVFWNEPAVGGLPTGERRPSIMPQHSIMTRCSLAAERTSDGT